MKEGDDESKRSKEMMAQGVGKDQTKDIMSKVMWFILDREFDNSVIGEGVYLYMSAKETETCPKGPFFVSTLYIGKRR